MGVAFVSLAESPEPGPPLAPIIPRVTAFFPRVWSEYGCLSSVSVGGAAFLGGGFLGGTSISSVFRAPGVCLVSSEPIPLLETCIVSVWLWRRRSSGILISVCAGSISCSWVVDVSMCSLLFLRTRGCTSMGLCPQVTIW